MTSSTLDISLFGDFSVRRNGQSLEGAFYGRMRALLAYLAVETGGLHRRDGVASLLWDSVALETARGNLRRTLADLRRALEQPGAAPLFDGGRQHLRLLPGQRVDVLDFLAAPEGVEERAIALYRGEFLAGLEFADCPPAFEEWLQSRREMLQGRALALLERLAERHQRAGEPARAVPFVLRQSELQPWNEAIHRRLIGLYAASGQKEAALHHAEVRARRLQADLGTLPGEDTRRLADALFGGRPPSDPAAQKSALVERRPVTVLYAEPELPAEDDPDEILDRLRGPQERCDAAIRRYGGHRVQTHDGGILVYFGYPQADEYAARHAVLVGLAMVAPVNAAAMPVRVGIHSGVVMSGNDAALPDAVGRTSRIAIRLLDGIRPGQVVLTEPAWALTAGFFTGERAASAAGSGVGQPLYRVSGRSPWPTRVAAAVRLTPFAGREAERALLDADWRAIAADPPGQRRVVLIRGEAGIGKTRLLHAFRAGLDGEPHEARELRCYPESRSSPFYPVIALLENELGFAPGDTPAQQLDTLANQLDARHPALAARAAPLLAYLLSLPTGGRYALPEVSPKQLKEQTIGVLLDLLQAMASSRPVLLVVEDLHWIDPSSLELLQRLVAEPGRRGILVLLTARPEFVPPWPAEAARMIDLAPLPEADVLAMVRSLDAALPAAVARGIAERADGIPLYIEEMARLAAGADGAAVPATLLDLLAARLDRVGPARATAQLAACVGRDFDPELLRRVSPLDPAALEADLGELQEAGLIRPHDAGGGLQFKHALIQEVAYQSQGRAARRAAHGRIAVVLRRDYAELIAAQPERLAQHLAGAGEILPAIAGWSAAGQRAAQASANREALGHFRAALDLAAGLAPGAERDRMEFSLLTALIPVLYVVEGYGSPEAGRANARVAELSDRLDDSPELFPARWAVVLNAIGSNGPRGIPEAAEHLLGIAGDDPVRRQVSHYLGVNSCFWLGEFERSIAHYEASRALYRPEHQALLLAQYGTDFNIFSASLAAAAMYFLGYPDRARALSDELLQRARELGHPHTLAQVLGFRGLLLRWMGESELALAASAEVLEIADRHDFLLWQAGGRLTHGWALVRLGRADEGLAELRACVAGMRTSLAGIAVVFLASLIDGLIDTGRHADALEAITETRAEMDRTGDGHCLAELTRLEGVCRLALDGEPASRAESLFHEALAISRRQHSRTLELRAAMSLAGLWRQQGRPAAARELLQGVHGGFSEGFQTLDLRAAATLLDELGGD